MSHLKRFLNTGLLLPLAAALCFCIAFLSETSTWAVGFQSRVHHAKTNILAGLSRSQRELVQGARQVLADPNLPRSIESQQRNTMEGSLASTLRSAIIDSLAVYDNNCQRIVSAEISRGTLVPCNASSSPYFLGLVSVVDRGNAPFLHVSLPLESRKDLRLAASVVLDRNWIGSTPGVAQAFKDFDLSISSGNDKGTRFLSFTPGVVLVSHSRLFALQEKMAVWLISLQSMLRSILMLVVIPLILVPWFASFRQKAALQKRLTDFANWVIGLTEGLNPADAAEFRSRIAAATSRSHLRGVVAQCRLLITKLYKSNRDQIDEMELKIAALQSSVNDKDRELLTQETARMRLRVYESTIQRMQSSYDQLLAIWSVMRGQIHSILKSDCDPLVLDSKSLVDWSKSWQNGAEEKGVRKFIRSLSETASNDQPQISMLEEQILRVERLTGHCALGIETIRAKLTDISQNAERTHHILADWLLLASEPQRENPTTPSEVSPPQDLNRCWDLMRQTLSAMTKGIVASDFRPLGVTRLCPAPQQIISSALFHLGRYLAGQLHRTDAPACNLIRLTPSWREQPNPILILTATFEQNGQQLGEDPIESPHSFRDTLDRLASIDDDEVDLDVAKRLLAPFAIKLNLLPFWTGGLSLSLHWSLTNSKENGSAAIRDYRAEQLSGEPADKPQV